MSMSFFEYIISSLLELATVATVDPTYKEL